MRFAIVGSGAVGGYYGAVLARAGHDVTFLARGAHLRAMRERGLEIRGLKERFTLQARVEEDPARVGPVDVVLLTVKTYDLPGALPVVRTLLAASGRPALGGAQALVLPLQNGVEAVDVLASAVGELPVLGGTTHLMTALTEPGVITQTGPLQRIALGEWFGDTLRVSPRVQALRETLAGAGLTVEAVPDARVPIWDKLAFLAPFSGFTAASRSPIGLLRDDPPTRALLLQAVDEVLQLARAEGVAVTATRASVERAIDDLPASGRASLAFDLEQGRPLEVEFLQGAVLRRGQARGVPTPVMGTLYAVLRPHAHGTRGTRGA